MPANDNCSYSGPPPRDISQALGQIQPPERMFIYGPSNPVSGENSAADPSKLKGGEFQLLQGMRFSNDEFRVRDGSFLLTASAPFANAAFRGAWSGYLNGSIQMFAAFRDPAVPCTKVFRVNNLTTNVWTYTEITNGSGTASTDETAGEAGTNNGTRFTADGYVSFAVVSDGLGPTPADILVFSNGINAPRTFGTYRNFIGTPTTTVATQGAITQPDASRCLSQPDFAAYVDLRTASSTTAVGGGDVSGVGVTNTKSTSSGETYFSFLFPAVVGTARINLTGATAAYQFDDSTTSFLASTTLQLSTGVTQFVMIVDDDITDPIFNYAAVIANSAGTPVTLYDPSSTLYDPPFYYALNTAGTQYLVAFNLLSAQVSVLAASIQLSVTQAPPTSRTVNVYGLLATGYAQSSRNHMVTFLDSQSRSESGGVICTNKPGPKLGGIGGRGCAGSKVSSKMPTPTGLYAIHQITYPTGASDLSPRVDFAVLYSQDPGETDYFYTQIMAAPRGTSFWLNNSFKYDNVKAGSRDLTRTGPAFSTRSTPYAAFLLSTNGRLYAGCIGNVAGTNPGYSEVWISFDRAPFRFSNIAPVTGPNAPKNPAYHRIQGEIVTGLQDYPGQAYGVAPVSIFTNKKVYRIEGTDSFSLSRLNILPNSVGSPFPRSIAKHNGSTYALGADRQIWKYGGSGDSRIANYDEGDASVGAYATDGPISRYKIDDRLKLADFTSCYGTATEYGYVLSSKEPGDSTQNNMYRFDAIKAKWGSDRWLTTGIAGTLKFDTADGTRRTLIFGDDGKIYWFEKAGTVDDAGTAIPVRIKTREFCVDMWQKMECLHLGMVATLPASPPTFTITKTGQVNGIASVSQINFTGASGNRVYRKDTINDTPKSMPGVLDVSVVVQIDGPAQGGMRFQSIMLEASSFPEEPDI